MSTGKALLYGFVGMLLAVCLIGGGWVAWQTVATLRAASFLRQPVATGQDGRVFTYADVLRDMATQTVQQAVKQQQQQPQPPPGK